MGRGETSLLGTGAAEEKREAEKGRRERDRKIGGEQGTRDYTQEVLFLATAEEVSCQYPRTNQ